MLQAGSITARSGRVSVTIASDIDNRTLMMIYKTRSRSGEQVSELPFWCRLGEDEEFEIHDSPDEDRMILLDDFVFRVLSPFFSEIIDQSGEIHACT